ncbi:hypothetical protein B0H13DRAFT_2483124 [Mycena leptocephala]|nr:hypothetical protein B0H13DRAFT_2483124 [Mycena leptocephala]
MNLGLSLLYSLNLIAWCISDSASSDLHGLWRFCAKRFIERANTTLKRLDGAILNAGINKCPPASVGILSCLPSEVVQILKSMPGGSEDEWMRNEPMGDFQKIHTPQTLHLRVSFTPLDISVSHFQSITSQHIHVSGTELQGTFERWNRGVDVYYYPTLGAERTGVGEHTQPIPVRERQRTSRVRARVSLRPVCKSDAKQGTEEQKKERERKKERRQSRKGETRKETHVARMLDNKREKTGINEDRMHEAINRTPRENEEKVPSENHPSPHSRANGSTKDEAAALGAVFGLCGQHTDKRVLRRSSKGRFLESTRRVYSVTMPLPIHDLNDHTCPASPGVRSVRQARWMTSVGVARGSRWRIQR